MVACANAKRIRKGYGQGYFKGNFDSDSIRNPAGKGLSETLTAFALRGPSKLWSELSPELTN